MYVTIEILFWYQCTAMCGLSSWTPGASSYFRACWRTWGTRKRGKSGSVTFHPAGRNRPTMPVHKTENSEKRLPIMAPKAPRSMVSGTWSFMPFHTRSFVRTVMPVPPRGILLHNPLTSSITTATPEPILAQNPHFAYGAVQPGQNSVDCCEELHPSVM